MHPATPTVVSLRRNWLLLLLALIASLGGCARATTGRASPLEPRPAAATAADGRKDAVESRPAMPGVAGADGAGSGAQPAADRLLATELLAGTDGDLLPPEIGAWQGDRTTRTRLVHRDGKYPLRRIEEVLIRTPGGVVVASSQEMVADHVLVRIRPGSGAAAEQAITAAGCSIRRRIPDSGLVLAGFPYLRHGDYPRIQADLRRQAAIALVEQDWAVQASITPDDPLLGLTWGLHNTGQSGGRADADIDAPEAWDITTGSRSVVVGIIDSGIDLTHPDLAANLWSNPGESGPDADGLDRRSNGIDDDGNGYIDDWRGWNFVAGTNSPQDDHFHGTHVAGTIGAVGGNGLGVAGVCWQVSLVGLKFLDANGGGVTSDAVEAVLYANALGLPITNNSWGGGGFSQALLDAIVAGQSSNHLFIAAAGNSGIDLAFIPSYPASYDAANIISVAASDSGDLRASFSNYGTVPVGVDLAAPGAGIHSCFPMVLTSAMAARSLPLAYGSISGTSMAAPHVSGVAALYLSVAPAATFVEIRNRILAACDPVGVSGVPGGRRLNAAHVVDTSWTTPPAVLSIGSVAFTEDQGPDRLANPGEILSLTPSVCNGGGLPASDVTVRIAAAPGLGILTGTATVGSIAVGGTGSPAVPLRVQVPADAVDGDVLAVSLAAESPDSPVASLEWRIRVFSPQPASYEQPTWIPGQMVALPGADRIYVADLSSPAVRALSTTSGAIEAMAALSDAPILPGAAAAAPGTWCSDLSISRDGTILYVPLPRAMRIDRIRLPDMVPLAPLATSIQVSGVIEAANGELLASELTVSGIRRLSRANGALLGTVSSLANVYKAAALVSPDQGATIFVVERGLYQSGAPGTAIRLDGASLAINGLFPYPQVYLTQFACGSPTTAYAVNSGIYGLTRLDLQSRTSSTWSPGGGATYGRGCTTLYGSGSVWGAFGGSALTLERWDGTGERLAEYRFGGNAADMRNGSMAMTANGVVVAGTYTGVVAVGCPPLQLESAPEARFAITSAFQSLPAMVSCDASASGGTPAGGLTYAWDWGDGASETSVDPILGHGYAAFGTYAITLQVTDAAGRSGSRRTIVEVYPRPQLSAPGVVTPEDTDAAVSVTTVDPLGEPLTYAVATPPVHGTLIGSGPAWTYRPATDYTGEDAFTVTATNGHATSLPLTIPVTVTPVNDPPSLVVPRMTIVNAGESALITFAASDPEDAALVWETLPPSIGSLAGSGPGFTYTAPADGSGAASFQVRVGDGQLWSPMQTVAISISPTPIPGADWPTQGGGNQRTGVSPTPVATLSLQWQRPLGWSPNPIAIGGGRIVLTAAARNTNVHYLLSMGCWELASGTLLWSKDLNTMAFSAPAAGSTIAYVQDEGNHDNLLTAYDTGTGATIFSQPWNNQIGYYGGPILAGRQLYTGGGWYGGIYRWDAATGAQAWFRQLDQAMGHTPALSEDGAHVYAVVGGHATATDAASGAPEWSLALPHNAAWDHGGASPVVVGDRLVFHVPDGSAGYLDCIDRTTGSLLWSRSIGPCIGSPAVDAAAGRVYSRTSTALTSYDLADGSVVATSAILDAGLARSQPVVASDAIIVPGTTATWFLHPVTLGTIARISGGGQVAIASQRLVIAGSAGISCYSGGPAVLPTATPQNVVLAEDASATITLSGADPQNDPLSFSLVALPAHGTLSGTPPTVVYTPAANYAGLDSFSFAVADPSGPGTTATVGITVQPVNDRPIANPATLTIMAGHSRTCTLTGSDIEGSYLTWRVVGQPLHATTTLYGNQLTVTPTAGYDGGDSLSVACRDGQLESAPVEVAITVAPITPGKILSEQALASGGFAQSVDVSGDYLVVGAPGHSFGGTAYVYRLSDGRWILDGALVPGPSNDNRFGTSVAISGTTVAVGSCDISTSWARATIFTRTPAGTWRQEGVAQVTGGEQAVVAQEDAWSIPQAAWVDIEGDQLVVGSPFDGTGSVSVFRRNAGIWTLEAKLARPANVLRWGWSVAIAGDTVLAGAHRSTIGSAEAGIAAVSTRTGGTWSTPLVLAPADRGAYDWFGFSVALAGGQAVIGSPQASDGGIKRGLVYIFGREESAWVQRQRISNPIGAAEADYDQFGKAVACEGTRILASAPYHYQPGIGSTGAVHRLELSAGAWQPVDRWVAADASAGDWASEALAVDAHTGVVGVTLDDDLGTDTGAAYVISYNRAPADQSLTMVTAEDVAADLTPGTSDPDGDRLTVTLTGTCSRGTATCDGSTVHYQPSPDQYGDDLITFTLADAYGGTATGSIAVTITPVNDPPICADATLELDWNTAGSVRLVGSDPDGTTPTFRIVTPPRHGTAGITGDLLTYTPAPDWSGHDAVAVVADDGEAASAVANVAVTVAGPIWDAELRNGAATIVTLVATGPQAVEAGLLGRATLQRSGPLDAALAVGLVYGGTAANGLDVRWIADQVIVPAGQPSLDIAIEALPDGLAESAETVVLTLAPGPGYTLVSGTPQQACIALMDDAPVAVSIVASDSSMGEPADHGRFTVARTGPTTSALTVKLAQSGTAVAGRDIARLPASITIPAGAAAADLPAVVIDDTAAEERETVTLSILPDAAYRVGSGQATVIIADNEPETIAIENAGVQAAEPGIAGTFRIFRRGSCSAARTVAYSVGGTAIAGSDYPALPGSVVLAANAGSVNLIIAPIDDGVVETAETVVVKLVRPSGAGLAIASASMTILDNDGASRPMVSLLPGAVYARESSADGTFVITRTGPTTAALRVRLQAPGGTAVAGQDYATLPTVVDLPAGQASVTLAVHALDDQIAEATETVQLSLAADPGYGVSATRTGLVAIADDDTPSLSIAVADASAGEAGGDTGSFTIRRLGDLSRTISVACACDGTAVNGVDFAALPESIALPAGSASATVILTAMDDAEAEVVEQAILRLLPDPAYHLDGATAGAVAITDDEMPVLDLVAVDASATEGGDTATVRVIRRGSLEPALTAVLGWSGTAQRGVDLTNPSASLRLGANAACADIAICPRQDGVSEEAETVIGTLLPGSGYAIGQAEATIRLYDDEMEGHVSIRLLSSEGYEFDADPTAFEIYRTGRLSAAITVPYLLAGTAQVHELDPPRQAVLPIGVDRVRISLRPLRDERVEPDETVILTLQPGPGYTLGVDAEAIFTIRESPPGSG